METPLKRSFDDMACSTHATPLANTATEEAPVSKLAKVPIAGRPTSPEDDLDRVHSPNNIMEAHTVVMPSRESKRALVFATKRDEQAHAHDDPMAEKRVTIWNWREQRKLSGNSAPFKKNLKEYIRKHPDWEEYLGQDKDAETGKKLTHKSMHPPRPLDPDHPWYTMQRTGTLPPAPAPAVAPSASNQSSYSTRSRESRLSETDSPRLRTRTDRYRDAAHHGYASGPPLRDIPIDPELHLPMKICMEPPKQIVRRRSIELETRRRSIAETIEPSPEERAEEKAAVKQEAAKRAEEEASWAAACAVYDRLQQEKENLEKHKRETSLAACRAAHAEKQSKVAAASLARIAARISNKKRSIDMV